MLPTPVHATALALHDAGICVLPAATDGTKRPAADWKRYQQTRPTREDIDSWFAAGHPGLGAVCGTVSGGLEMLELEGLAIAEGALEAITELANDSGLGDLWTRVSAGYTELTPGGGLHWLIRVTDAPAKPNTKLARRPATDTELAANPGDRIKVLAETRGEGGWTVLAPSNGTTHPSGRGWVLAAGGPTTIAHVTAAERDALHALLASVGNHHQDVTNVVTGFAQPASQTDGGTSPGDDYNARADWADILTGHGWTRVTTRGALTYWRRPGKNLGISATTGVRGTDSPDYLYVFSSSTDFDPDRAYTKFAAASILDHGGDFKAAATALKTAGYGTPPPPPPETPRPAAAVSVDEPKSYSRTDDGNALRLVDTHGTTIRYCGDKAAWLTWDGSRWRWDVAGVVPEHARTIARRLPNESYQDEKHRKYSLSGRGLELMLRVARTDPRVRISLTDLDANPYQLNTPGGVVDLRTGHLHDPDPASLHSRSTTVTPAAGEPTRWLTFLAETFAGDPALTTYVQQLLGLSLIGTVLDPVLPFCHGSGANGKSVLLDVAQQVLGIGADGYAQPAPAELLLASTTTSHPTELANLAGARLVVASELEAGQRFAEARIKQLTGKDTISARFMRQDFFSFRPSHTIWLLANDQPAVRVGGPAFWRRLRLVPFLNVVPPENRITDLADQLVNAEGPAILAWCITGAVQFLEHGLTEPASVRVATADYAHDQDTVARFLEDRCETGEPSQPHMRVKVAELRAAYEHWCRVEGETPLSARALTQALVGLHGVTRDRDMQARFYAGVRLVDASSDPSSDASADATSDEWWQR